MILTLPVSHLINRDNWRLITGIGALEYKKAQSIDTTGVTKLFHANCGIIQNGFIDYFDSIIGFLIQNEIKLFSCDLGPAAEDVEIIDSSYQVKSPLLSMEKLEEIIYSKISYIKSKFSGDIALENLNFFLTPAYKHVCEPDFINRVLKKNGIYLLLDLAHAAISAYNMKLSVSEYITSLPLNSVREIHISRPAIMNGRYYDFHEKPDEAMFELLDSVLKKVKKDTYIAVEFYKDFNDLASVYQFMKKKYL